jgi:hypothetical protein
MTEQLDEAVEADDVEAVAAMQQQLQEMQKNVEAGIRAAKPPANVRRWLQVCSLMSIVCNAHRSRLAGLAHMV